MNLTPATPAPASIAPFLADADELLFLNDSAEAFESAAVRPFPTPGSRLLDLSSSESLTADELVEIWRKAQIARTAIVADGPVRSLLFKARVHLSCPIFSSTEPALRWLADSSNDQIAA